MDDLTTSWTILDRAHAALQRVVADVPDGGRHLATPCADWDVAQVIEHAAGDQLGYAAFLGYGSGPEFDPFAPSGAHPDLMDLVRRAVDAAGAAFATVPPGREDVPVPVPPNTLTAPLAVAAAALDAAVHAWDVAVATAQDSPLDDALATELTPVARTIVDPLRGFAFGPALPVVGDAGAASALLRYLGRDPSWARAIVS